MSELLRIGLVSISDRASSGVYEDKGIPALQAWFGQALTSPWEMETRLIPDEQPHRGRPHRAVRRGRLPSGADHRRHRPGPRDVTPEATLAVADR
jgi:molybdopterin adenylyltransferase